MGYHFKVKQDGKYFIASCIELEGCRTQAFNEDELNSNMEEVLSLYLDEPANSKMLFPEPKKRIKKSKYIREVYPETRIWFSHCLRQARLKEKLSQREAAKRIGIKSVSGYQKLEKRANPTIETAVKIKKAFPNFNFNLSELAH